MWVWVYVGVGVDVGVDVGVGVGIKVAATFDLGFLLVAMMTATLHLL